MMEVVVLSTASISQPQEKLFLAPVFSVVYSRAAISSGRPEPLLAYQRTHSRVASGEARHCPGPALSGADPGAGFSGQPVPGQGEWNPSFAR